jgi:hypothetical protein
LPPIEIDDPSEAIRSAEIREQLAVGFEIEHERGYGGNVLAVILPALDLARLDEATLRDLFERGTPSSPPELPTRTP